MVLKATHLSTDKNINLRHNTYCAESFLDHHTLLVSQVTAISSDIKTDQVDSKLEKKYQ